MTVAAVSAGRVVAPLWRRGRLWVGLVALVVVGAFVLALIRPAPGLPLDPSSASKDGSKALAVLLEQRGTRVDRATALATLPPGVPVVVASPDAYDPQQLSGLASSGHRLVLIDPSERALLSVAPSRHVVDSDATGSIVAPDCPDSGAQAAGRVSFLAGTAHYSGPRTCFGGRVVLDVDLVVLGSPGLVRNDHLTATGVAAMAVNAISVNSATGNVGSISWLLPGADARGGGAPSVWSLFPDWTRRAALWLLLVGVIVALWRGRRLGPPVREPLPVVVRAAEIVEGHGRLYARAGARGRAAELLRGAAIDRLADAFQLPESLPRHDRLAGVLAALDRRPAAGRDPAVVLAGPIPEDDRGLIQLARDLDRLQRSAQMMTDEDGMA